MKRQNSQKPAPRCREPALSKEEYARLFKAFLFCREFFGAPPDQEFGGLTREQIAALVVEHEQRLYPEFSSRVRQACATPRCVSQVAVG